MTLVGRIGTYDSVGGVSSTMGWCKATAACGAGRNYVTRSHDRIPTAKRATGAPVDADLLRPGGSSDGHAADGCGIARRGRPSDGLRYRRAPRDQPAGVRRHLDALLAAGRPRPRKPTTAGGGQQGPRPTRQKWFNSPRPAAELRHAYDDLASAALLRAAPPVARAQSPRSPNDRYRHDHR